MANKEVLDKLRALKIDRTTDLNYCNDDGMGNATSTLEILAKSWLEEARLTSAAQIKGGVGRAKELTAAAALVELELIELRKRVDAPMPEAAPEIDEWATRYPHARIEHAVRPSSAHPEPGWSAKCVEPSCPGFWRTGFASERQAKLTYEAHWAEKHHEPEPSRVIETDPDASARARNLTEESAAAGRGMIIAGDLPCPNPTTPHGKHTWLGPKDETTSSFRWACPGVEEPVKSEHDGPCEVAVQCGPCSRASNEQRAAWFAQHGMTYPSVRPFAAEEERQMIDTDHAEALFLDLPRVETLDGVNVVTTGPTTTTLAGTMALELSQGALSGFRERVENGAPTFNLGPLSTIVAPFSEPSGLDEYCPACDACTHTCPGCGTDVPHGTIACNLCSVEYPPGTPEYEAYATELRAELDKFAKGQDPYPYPSAVEQRVHETIDREYAHVTAESVASPFREAQAPTSRSTPRPVNAPDAYSWTDFGPLSARHLQGGIPEHVSPSQLSTMDKCPAQARMSRYDGAPGIPLWGAVGGTAFHKVIERFERTSMQTGVPIWATESIVDAKTESVVDSAWSAAFHQAIAEEFAKGHGIPMDDWYASNRGKENYSWWLAEGSAMVRRWVEFRRTHPDYEILVLPDGRPVIELELMLKVDGAPPVKVILDSAWKLPDGDIEIIDYKTGSRMEKDTIQLGTQAHALVEEFRNYDTYAHGNPLDGDYCFETLPRVYARYFDARKGVLTEPLDALKRHPLVELQMRYADLDDRRRNRPALPKRSDLCVACPVRYLCPAYAQ